MDADSSGAQAVATRPTHRNASKPASPEEFFRMHYRGLIKSTMYFGADYEQAEEAVARALVEVVRNWDDLDTPRQWAYRAAVNHYLKEKERGLDPRRKRLAKMGAGTPEGDDNTRMTVWEDKQWVRQMLDLIPPKQAEVMSLVIEGFAPIEIAKLLGRTPGAVRQSLLEARTRLKQAIRQERGSDQQLGSAQRFGKKA